ncbi:MAG: hypothetical protein HYU69_04180, partial [Bacteroidetes bacterium]|nr:hypothetical protein [Bacteroidota bacterium]
TGTDVQTACNSYTWIDGINYTTSTNTPTFTIVGGSAQGCDSVVTLNLTINNSTTGNDIQTACNSYTWIDGNNYTASTNTPTYTIAGGSSQGCDSIVTLNLTINTFASGTDVQTACNSYTWIDGNNYTASTNTPTYTIVGGSSEGCDSIVHANLHHSRRKFTRLRQYSNPELNHQHLCIRYRRTNRVQQLHLDRR